MEENLKNAINNFYTGKCKDFHQTVLQIRQSYAALLREQSDFSFLTQESNLKSFRTVRGQMWGIFLSLGKFDCPDVENLFSDVTVSKYQEMVRYSHDEIDRIKKGEQRFIGINDKEYSVWLTLFSGYIYKEKKRVFSQETYTFGIMFLKNFDTLTAYQAYVHLMNPIKNSLLFNTTKVTKLCEISYEIISASDADLSKYFEEKKDVCSPFLTSYAPLSSLFTQLQPIESVELFWDFLLIYGIEFCVYLQASWLILRKDDIINNHKANIASDHAFRQRPVDLIMKAVHIYQNLDTDAQRNLQSRIHDALYDE